MKIKFCKKCNISLGQSAIDGFCSVKCSKEHFTEQMKTFSHNPNVCNKKIKDLKKNRIKF